MIETSRLIIPQDGTMHVQILEGQLEIISSSGSSSVIINAGSCIMNCKIEDNDGILVIKTQDLLNLSGDIILYNVETILA